MKINTRQNLVILLLLTFAITDLAMADQIYKWTDPDGVTHYSETPPVVLNESVDIPVDIIGIDLSGYQNIPAKDDYYSIVNQARRLEESQLKKEKLRLERDAQRLAEYEAMRKNQAAPIVIQQSSYPVYRPVPVFYPHGYYKHRGKYRAIHQHDSSPRNQTGLGNSPALQVRAVAGKSQNASPALQIGFEGSVPFRR